jgi:hypothetical protein
LSALQKYALGEQSVWQRCKRTAILWNWVHGMSVHEIERRFSTTPVQGAVSLGDITRITEGTRYHLRSAHQILTAIFPEESEFLISIEALNKRLEFGLPVEALPLTELSQPLTRGQYLALYNAGIVTASDIMNLSYEHLKDLVGITTANRILPQQETDVA